MEFDICCSRNHVLVAAHIKYTLIDIDLGQQFPDIPKLIKPIYPNSTYPCKLFIVQSKQFLIDGSSDCRAFPVRRFFHQFHLIRKLPQKTHSFHTEAICFAYFVASEGEFFLLLDGHKFALKSFMGNKIVERNSQQQYHIQSHKKVL